MEFRNVKVQRFVPDRIAGVPYLNVMATKNSKRVSLFLVNRNVHAPMKVRINGVPAGMDAAWSLSGPAVDSDNEKNPEEVAPRPIPVARQAGGLVVTLPAHSFSVVSTVLLQR
jgi:alpha-L-arabinofuranosidase